MNRIQSDDLHDRDYPIQEDMGLQTRLWRLERLGWAFFFLVVVMTLLGAFSSGVLSETTANSPDGRLSVSYQRFERNGAASSFSIHISENHVAPVIVRIEGDFLERFTVESMQPEPASSRSQGNGLELTYKPDSTGTINVRFSLRPEGMGMARSRISASSAAVETRQFVYP